MTEMTTDFGQRLRNARSASGMSQRELARKIDADSSYISRLESGDRANPTMSTLRSLADALDVSVSALVDGEES